MDKYSTNNPEISLKETSHQEHKDYQRIGTYLRDDHCDWGSSGMNEFTEEFSEKS